MKTLQWIAVIAVVGNLSFVFAAPSWAAPYGGMTPEQRAAMEERVEQLRARAASVPEFVRDRLSGAGLSMITLPERWDRITMRPEPKGPPVGPRLLEKALPGPAEPELPPAFPFHHKLLPPAQVSDPSVDSAFSRLAGFTQSETTTSWCNRTVVVGYNDSGSLFEAIATSPSGSFSFNGWALSTNRGRSFADMGALLSDPLPWGVDVRDLGGDPVIGCADSLTWYYGSLATDFLFGGGVLSGISVSKSTDGAETFGGAVMAASKDGFTHLLDKLWMAVDPTDTQREHSM